MKNFDLERLRFEREQRLLALDKAVEQLDVKTVERLVDELEMEPIDLKELQSKTSQLPNLFKGDPQKHAAAKKLADAINARVSESRVDKSHEQQDFLSVSLIHKLPKKGKNSDLDEIR
jgi:hypothetical protein